MNKKIHKIVVVISLLLILLSIIYIYRPVKAQHKLSFTAEVAEARMIIVDKKLNIVQIISNTRNEVVPTVRVENQKGNVIAMTDTVLTQYEALKPTLNFSKIGKVYDRDDIRIFGIKLPEKINNWIVIIKRLFLVKS